MTDKVLLVTAPDDVLADSVRILIVNLVPEQSQIISDAINSFTSSSDLVLYVWKNGESIEWLLDKKHKSDAIIFNADDTNDLINGYLLAQSKSYYFGQIKDLTMANKNAIYTVDQCVTLLDKLITKYE